MKVSRVILVVFLGSQFVSAEGFSFSLGLVSLGVAGLTALRLYIGLKMLAPGFRHAQNTSLPNLDDQKFELALNITLPNILPADFGLKTGSKAPVSTRIRRDASGTIRLSKGFLRWLKSIDDVKCIHRFFCELGTDQTRFGNLGRLTNILISMGGLPKDSWAQDMFDAGQDGKPCPSKCDEHELSKTVDYLERHFFAAPTPGADLETKDNEIPT